MDQIFVSLYPLVAIVSLIGYFPQIMALVKARTPDDKISLKSWGTWVGTYFISIGYGVFHLKDPYFIANTIFSMSAMIAVIALVLYNRHVRFANMAK